MSNAYKALSNIELLDAIKTAPAFGPVLDEISGRTFLTEELSGFISWAKSTTDTDRVTQIAAAILKDHSETGVYFTLGHLHLMEEGVLPNPSTASLFNRYLARCVYSIGSLKEISEFAKRCRHNLNPRAVGIQDLVDNTLRCAAYDREGHQRLIKCLSKPSFTSLFTIEVVKECVAMILPKMTKAEIAKIADALPIDVVKEIPGLKRARLESDLGL